MTPDWVLTLLGLVFVFLVGLCAGLLLAARSTAASLIRAGWSV